MNNVKELLRKRLHNKITRKPIRPVNQQIVIDQNRGNVEIPVTKIKSESGKMNNETELMFDISKFKEKKENVIFYPSVVSGIMKTTVLNWNKNTYNLVFDFNKLLEYNGISTSESQESYIKEWEKKSKVKLKAMGSIDTSNLESVQNRVKEIEEIKEIDQTVKKLLIKEYNCEYGTKKEDSALDIYNNTYNTKVKFTNELLCKNFKDYTLGGRVDGLNLKDPENPIVVEAKNRTKKLFNFIPVYEKMQVHCYMKMLNVKESHLIEKYENTHKIHSVPFDDDFYDYIHEYFNTIKNVILEIKKDPEIYIGLDISDKKKFLISRIRN